MSRKRYIAPALVAAAAAVSIAAAPTALAVPSSTDLGGGHTVVQSPGNVQINDAPPVHYAPQYPDFGSLLFHHGGHHR